MEKNQSGGVNIGLLVGSLNGGTIENCHASGKIIVNGEAGGVSAAGLVGSMSNGEIKNSTSNAEIILTSERLFTGLEKELEQIEDQDIKEVLLNLVNQMEMSQGKGTFKYHYDNFISSAANYTTLISPFLPRLFELTK